MQKHHQYLKSSVLAKLTAEQVQWVEQILAGTHRATRIPDADIPRYWAVYLSQQGDSCAFKIGYSGNVDARNKMARTDNCAGAEFRVLQCWEFVDKKTAHRFEQELLDDRVLRKYRGGTNKRPTEWLLPKAIRAPLTKHFVLSRIAYCVDSYLEVVEKRGNRNVYKYREQ